MIAIRACVTMMTLPLWLGQYDFGKYVLSPDYNTSTKFGADNTMNGITKGVRPQEDPSHIEGILYHNTQP